MTKRINDLLDKVNPTKEEIQEMKEYFEKHPKEEKAERFIFICNELLKEKELL